MQIPYRVGLATIFQSINFWKFLLNQPGKEFAFVKLAIWVKFYIPISVYAVDPSLLVLQWYRLSCCLWCALWSASLKPADSVLTQLPADVSGKATDINLGAWFAATPIGDENPLPGSLRVFGEVDQ